MEVLWNTSFLIVLGSFLIIVADGLSWLRKPLDTQAPKGGSVTFHCEVNNLGDKSVIWTNATGSVLFSNSARFSAPMRYTVVGKYNLNISNIQESDNGQFVCNVQDFATETARLTVLLPPGPPVITRNVTGSSFTEGQTVAFVCKSTGGNPNPTITWLKNGQEIFNSEYSRSSTVGGVSSSQISPVLDRTDHKANYTCVVYNTINSNNKLTANQILSVRYSPHITFKDYNPLYVLLGRDASIICQVDANPSISSVTWIKEGKTLLGRQLTRYFRPTTKSDSGVYKCQASNGIGDIKDANIEVNVVYAPIITIPAKKTARELDRVQITCNIDANPKPYQFQWERVDGNQTMIRQNRNLVFNTIGRADAGKYACKAWSQIKVSGEEPTTIMEQKIIQVFVEYQPGNAFIKPVVDYNKGDRVVLKCEANPPGYPSADFEWKKGNSVLTETGGTLSIRSAQLSDNGEYTCTPVNSVGRGGQSSITLTVNEPPSMIENPPSEITQPLSNTETMTLTCRVKGRPTPTVQWFKDEDSVSVMTLYPDFYSVELTDETTDQYSSQIRSVLVFRGLGRRQTSNGFTALRVEDIGNYTCAVMSSAHAQMLRPRTQLSLQFKPRVSTHEDRVAVNIHEDAVLPCIALAFPAPSYQWYRNGQELQAGQGHYLTQTTQIGTAEYRSDLTILRVRDGDLGEYKCFATNFLGNVSQPIGLTVKTQSTTGNPIRNTTAGGYVTRSDVVCSATSFTFAIPDTVLPQHNVTLRDPACVVVFNGSHYVATVGLNDCGTTVQFTKDSVIFRNELSAHVSHYNFRPGPVSFGDAGNLFIPVECVYPRRANVSMAYLPLHSKLRIFEKRYGHLDFELTEFSDDQFQSEIPSTSLPKQLPLNQELHIKLSIGHSSSSKIGIYVDNCLATPTPSPNYPVFWPLLKNGCSYQPELHVHHSSSLSEFLFSFNAFKFVSTNPMNMPSLVYVHCQVSACYLANCATSCQGQGQTHSRRRRGAMTHSSHLVSTGPFILLKDQESSPQSAGVIVSTSVAAVACLVAVVAVVAWRINRTNQQKYHVVQHDLEH